MKNPFTSNDNIFDKIARRQPSKREPVLTRGGPTRDRTPTRAERIDLTAGGPAERGVQPIQNLQGYIPSDSYGYLAGTQVEGKAIGYNTLPPKRQQSQRFALPSYNTYEDSEQPFRTEYIKPMAGLVQVSAPKEPTTTGVAFIESIPVRKHEMKQQDSSTKYTKSQHHHEYKTKAESQFLSYQGVHEEGPPQIGKPNPFLKPHLFQTLNSKQEERASRRSEKFANPSPAFVRDKSLTNPRNQELNPNQKLKAVVQQAPYVMIDKNEPTRQQLDTKYQLPTPINRCPEGNVPASARTNSRSTSQDTLQRLNELFNQPHLNIPTYGDEEALSPKGPTSLPLQTESHQRQRIEEDKLDPTLFEDYIKICMMNPTGRQQLRKLVGMDIPEPSAKVTERGQGQLNKQVTADHSVATLDRLPTVQSQDFRSAKTQPNHQQIVLPTFNKFPLEQQQLAQQPVHNQHQQVNKKASPIDTSSMLVRQRSPFHRSHFEDPEQDRSYSTFIEVHESVPKVKPYQPTVLTEKSNLKVASSCTKHLEISQLKEPPKPSAGSEEEMKLEINCDLNRRVEEKLKQHYQAGLIDISAARLTNITKFRMEGGRRQFVNELASMCTAFFGQMSNHYHEVARRLTRQSDLPEKKSSKDINGGIGKQHQMTEPQLSKGCLLFQSENKPMMQSKFRAFNDFEIDRLLVREWSLLEAPLRAAYESKAEGKGQLYTSNLVVE